MSRRKRKSNTRVPIGCGFLITNGFAICALLVVNAMIVRSLLTANLSNIDERIIQASQFVLPVIMIFFEFWFFDLVTQRHFEDDSDE